MSQVVLSFAYGLYILAAISFAFMLLAWRRRGEPGGPELVIYNAAIVLGAITYSLDIQTVDPHTKFFWASFGLVGMAVTASSWLSFALTYTGRDDWMTTGTRFVLIGEPTAVAFAALMPTDWGLLYTLPETGGQGSMTAIGATVGPVIFGHFIYVVIAMLIGTVLLLQLAVRSRHLSRSRTMFLITAAAAPWTGVLIRGFGISGQYDASIFVWGLSGAALTLALNEVRVFDPVPAGHTAVVEEMSDGVLVVDPDGVVGYANPAAIELLGVDGDIAGQAATSIIEDWESLHRTTEWQEQTRSTEDGRVHMELHASPFTDHLDRIVGHLVLLRDVTERQRREELLARYKTVVESVRDRVFVVDTSGEFVLVNEPLADYLGYEESALIGAHVERAVQASREEIATFLESPDETLELEAVTASGETIPSEVRLATIEFEDDVEGVVGVVHDIRRRKQMEADLEETMDRLDTLVAASPLAIIACDAEGTVDVWNPAAEELFGWTADEVIGEFLPIIPDDRSEIVRARYDRVLAGTTLTGLETEVRREDDSLVDVSVSIAPVTDADGEVSGTVSVLSDITERKAREQALERQNERLDEFASVVSHDLRNPLNVAEGYLALAAAEGADENIEKAQAALDRMSGLIDDVLTLAREGRDIGDREPIEFDEVVKEAWQSVHTNDASLELHPQIPDIIHGDEGRVTELLENLFRNCVEHGSTDNRDESRLDDSVEHGSTNPRSRAHEDSVEHGSTDNRDASRLDDSVEHGTGTDDDAAAAAGGDAGDFLRNGSDTSPSPAADDSPLVDQEAGSDPAVTVSVGALEGDGGFFVADDGPGIPPEKRETVFDPGETTDPEGTGFGLAIVRRIAQAHDWDIAITESDDGGARFEFQTDGVRP